jgi:hypothetical protein
MKLNWDGENRSGSEVPMPEAGEHFAVIRLKN